MIQLLTQAQIQQKIQRLAIEILERNLEEESILLAGINNNGMTFAQLLHDRLSTLAQIPLSLTQIRLNPADPLATEVSIGLPLEELQNKVVIIVDDVANTGRTIFYATKPLLQILPKKVEVAVLVDRTHKSFPVKVDYWGLSLATTVQENIEVKIREVEELAVFLH